MNSDTTEYAWAKDFMTQEWHLRDDTCTGGPGIYTGACGTRFESVNVSVRFPEKNERPRDDRVCHLPECWFARSPKGKKLFAERQPNDE